VSTSIASSDPGAFDALVSQKSQSGQTTDATAATRTDRPRASADPPATDDAYGDDWKTQRRDRGGDASDVSALGAATSAPAPAPAPGWVNASDPQDGASSPDLQSKQDSQNDAPPQASATSSLSSFLWTLRHRGAAKHAGRHHAAPNVGDGAASSQAQASALWVLSNLGAAADPGALGAAAASGAVGGAVGVNGALGVNGSANGSATGQGSPEGQGQGQVQPAAEPNAGGWRLDSSIERLGSSPGGAAMAGGDGSAPGVNLGAGGATVSATTSVTVSATASATVGPAHGQGRAHGQGHTLEQALALDMTLVAAVGADAANISGAKISGTAAATAPQTDLSSGSLKANAVTSASLTNFVIDAAAAGVAAATGMAPGGQPGVGTGGGSAQLATVAGQIGTRDTAADANRRAEGFGSGAAGSASKGLAPDVADAARRQAWSELARLLGSNQATTAGRTGGAAGANGASASATAASGTVTGGAGAGAAAGANGSAAASQASTGLAIVDSLSLASSSSQDRAWRAHANATETATDRANSFGAGDKAATAMLAASAFDGARAQTGHGDGDRSDAFASFAAALGLGRGAGDAIATTTTTAFPLQLVLSMATTAARSTDAAHSAAVAAGSGLPAAFAAQADGGDAAQQVIRTMRLQWSGSVGEAQLRLEPEHLGQVLVSVRVDQGNVSATLHADSAMAQQWIEAHQQDLRQALQDQGLRVTHFNVTTNPDDRARRDGSAPQDQPRNQQQPARRRDQRQNADGRTFEIRV
jgi:hypothetical protein